MASSILVFDNSARSLASSICSGLTRTPAPLSLPACCALIQLCSFWLEIPRIAATAAML